jgi:arylsulfatase B
LPTTARNALTRLAISLLLMLTAACRSSEAPPRPNIVILLVDDLGWNDVSYHGSEIPTPNIDDFVASGLELDRFYTAPWCTPTRSGLMTGLYPHRHDIPYKPRIGTGSVLPTTAVVLPQVLAAAGYRHRALIGKWHLGGTGTPALRPQHRGFTYFYGHLGGAIDYFQHTTIPLGGKTQPRPDWYRNDRAVEAEGYATDLLAREAEAFIEARAREPDPFLLIISFNAPHLPLQAKNDDLWSVRALLAAKLYEGRLLTPDKQLNRRILAAMLRNLDSNVGSILDTIDRVGIRDDTLILFLSDNGGDPRNGASDNQPLRGTKTTTWEGGVRVPAAIRWPGVFPAGERLDEVVSYIDILPTLQGITQPSAPAPASDGLDLFELLKGGAPASDRYVYLGDGSIVTRSWKLVRDQLFRIDTDPGEKHDVAAERPEIVEQLREFQRQARAPRRL